ncbi:Cytochrome b5 [Handroanthus impetiginosus]|uniref:Cytochrome b5 n=1 Tax=Handroanthus impetiginosus TaxID=429701 RepID=A0A2G9GLV2_9LAMI|nr:Cytochrome b5 [Handroanthus impetiginosus]
MAGKVHTFEEVANHNSKEDCWVTISGKVYNVTPFLEEHPGGDEILLMNTGKDATTEFEDVGHSSDAQEKMKEFYIGDIDTSTLPAKQQYTPPAPSSTANRDSGDSFNILL